MTMWTMALVSFITASLTLQAALKNGLIHENEEISVITNQYICHYASMWCSCHSNPRGGCDLGCSPNLYKSLYNQTHCSHLKGYVLSGFEMV